MTPEQLLKRRWQLIAPYPGSAYKFSLYGILTDGGDDYAYGENPNNKVHIETIEMCTANFTEIEWWEHRKVEDMPKYLRINGRLEKVKEHLMDDCQFIIDDGFNYKYRYYGSAPASEDEYLQSIFKVKYIFSV